MNILLDTHVWLWSLTSPNRISDATLDLMSNTDNILYLSAASSWEIAIRQLATNNPPTLLVFLSGFGVATSVT